MGATYIVISVLFVLTQYAVASNAAFCDNNWFVRPYPRHIPASLKKHNNISQRNTLSRIDLQKNNNVSTPPTKMPSYGSTRIFAKGKARFSTTVTTPSSPKSTTSDEFSNTATTATTSTIDSLLSLLTSDLGGVAFGSIGVFLCLWNRLSHLDDMDMFGAQQLGQQSRADLLAVFATTAVLLNGVSKLDVTSALAESVVLDGIIMDAKINKTKSLNSSGNDSIKWALSSVLDATPAKTAMLMQYNGDIDPINLDKNNMGLWKPIAYAGIVVPDERNRVETVNVRTPILDRFVLDENKQTDRKESYLPTLQALPGKVEFTYLPLNTQEALLLPVVMPNDLNDVSINRGDYGESKNIVVLVLGSDTAKSFTPRDIAWCQVLAARMGNSLLSDNY